MRDVSKLKFIGSSFCSQYQSQAKFYIDEAHASGMRHLVVVYENGEHDFIAGIPDEWWSWLGLGDHRRPWRSGSLAAAQARSRARRVDTPAVTNRLKGLGFKPRRVLLPSGGCAIDSM